MSNILTSTIQSEINTVVPTVQSVWFRNFVWFDIISFPETSCRLWIWNANWIWKQSLWKREIVNIIRKWVVSHVFMRFYHDCDCSTKRFAAVILRIREPKTTALVFSSGKMVCAGAKRWFETIHAQTNRRANIPIRFCLRRQRKHVPNCIEEICKDYPEVGKQSKTWTVPVRTFELSLVYFLGNQVTFTNFKIQNVVSSCGVDFNICLERLACAHCNFCS